VEIGIEAEIKRAFQTEGAQKMKYSVEASPSSWKLEAWSSDFDTKKLPKRKDHGQIKSRQCNSLAEARIRKHMVLYLKRGSTLEKKKSPVAVRLNHVTQRAQFGSKTRTN
jgi:hypothetical protein